MRSDIHVCARWESLHDRPVYTLADQCPECGGPAVNSSPAPYSPDDPYGSYRRRARRRADNRE